MLKLNSLPTATMATALCLPLMALLSCASPDPSPGDEATASEDATQEASSFDTEALTLESADPAFEAIFSKDAQIEVLAEGFTWSEGPVWISQGDFLLFSDVPKDTVYRWHERDGLSPWIQPSGYTSPDPESRSREPGANGLVLDDAGHLLLCQHGDRRVARLAADPAAGPFISEPAPFETVTATFDGKRYNSPNDLVVHPDGSIYFTDPPYGLIGEQARQLPHHGVYRVAPSAEESVYGDSSLLFGELSRPNGIVLSPDGKTLYVANSDPEKALWMSWPVLEDGSLGEGSILHDATAVVSEERPGLPDGMAVDTEGRLYATGPGGLWIFAADGSHLGTLRLPDATANVTFGEDGRTLFLTSHHRLLRVRTEVTGLGFSG